MENYHSQACFDVLYERNRQIKQEHHSTEHDDEYSQNELLRASVSYSNNALARGWVHASHLGPDTYQSEEAPDSWPWDPDFWKPKNPRQDLVRAAALLIAEIERIDRNTGKQSQACFDVLYERNRQIKQEHYSTEHDDKYSQNELLRASVSYSNNALARGWVHGSHLGPDTYQSEEAPDSWPWDPNFWKPKNPRQDLVRATALLIAEIERIDRNTEKQSLAETS